MLAFAFIITATLLLVPTESTMAATTNGFPHHKVDSLVTSNSQLSTGDMFFERVSRFRGNNRALQTGLDPGVIAALQAFYNSTNGLTWTNHTGWSFPPQSDPCTWYGLTCDINGKLSRIILQNNNLTGSLPPEIGDLTDLTVLDLLTNHITGNISPELGTLDNVTLLDLSANAFSGGIPIQLGDMNRLSNLNVYSNQLTGPIPSSLGSLANLHVLQLSDNQLTGSIPLELNNSTLLENFSVPNNKLSGPIPDLSSLTHLSLFRIDGNQLTGNIPLWLFNNPNLVTLNLNKNLLTGQIPVGLSNLTQLQYFEVAYNQLSGDIPVAITTLTHIIVVSTGFNMFTASNPAVKTFLDTKNPGWDQSQTIAPVNLQIGKVTSNSVEISWNPIPYTGDGGYYEVGYASTSGGPYTSSCTPNKTVATCIVNLLTPNTLYYFAVRTFTPAHDFQQNDLLSSYSQEVSSTTFPTTICDAAADYSECQALWLLYNGTNGANWTNKANWVANATPCTWYGVTCNVGGSVTQLSLGTNNLVGSIPTQLSYLTNLQQLSLNGNTLTGNIPTQMGSLVSLQNLNLSSNQLSGSIPTQFGSLASLQNLNLSSNQLSGSIPTQLGSLSNLVDLSLGGNQLSGSIPTQLGSLTTLQTLSLGENQLSGSIPTQLGNLVNLVTLNLANNALSGSIPIELSNITNPLTLDISFNLLTAVDANLIIWLNTKQPTWASTQTVAPTVILPTVVVSTNTIRVSWNPITYTADGGYYEVGYSSNINGPFNQSGCTTADKTVTTCDVHNLGYNTSYYFAVRTFTAAHGPQQNALLSGFSSIGVQGTTPTNDNFANSIIIPKPPYTNTLSNAVATLENLEQKGACEGTTNITKTIWYQYTALGTESVTFTVSGSAVVKGLSIWTGSSLGNLTQVGCATGANASVSMTTIYGTTYYIRLGSSNGVSSALTLQVTAPHGAPLRNSFVTQPPTLTWNRVTNATRYEIQVSKLSTFTTSVFPIASVPAGQLFFTTPQLAKGVYYWRVRAIRGTAVGAWSAFDSFVVQGP